RRIASGSSATRSSEVRSPARRVRLRPRRLAEYIARSAATIRSLSAIPGASSAPPTETDTESAPAWVNAGAAPISLRTRSASPRLLQVPTAGGAGERVDHRGPRELGGQALRVHQRRLQPLGVAPLRGDVDADAVDDPPSVLEAPRLCSRQDPALLAVQPAHAV